MADFRLSHRMRGEESFVQGDSSLLQVCLELGFHFLPAQAADVEFLLGIAFLLLFGFKLQSELAANEAVTSVALCTRHHSCM